MNQNCNVTCIILFIYSFILLFISVNCQLTEGKVYKRSLVEFRDVVQCATGRSSFSSFNNYGCYCGFGGKGEPMDGIDRCCYEHDHCYETSRKSYCNYFLVYTTPYKWECQEPNQPEQKFLSFALRSLRQPQNSNSLVRSVVDIINSTIFQPVASPKGIPVCIGSPLNCGKLLCECDVIAALCFANYVYPEKKPKCNKIGDPHGTIISTEDKDK